MNPTAAPLRILFFGMHGPFSIPPFLALIAHGFPPVGLVTPPPPGFGAAFRRLDYPPPPEESGTNTIYQLAARHAVPIYEIGSLQHRAAAAFRDSIDLDFIIVACFNRMLPKSWLESPRRGCINLHPSLLPAYRGPTPLEDQLANGETQTGITLHFMDEGADTGDIIVQKALPVPPGATLEDLNRLTAEAGARMLLRVLARPDEIPRWRQDR